MSNDTHVREFLQRMADEADAPAPDWRPPVKRARRRRTVTIAIAAMAVVAIVSAGSVAWRSFGLAEPRPANQPSPSTRPTEEPPLPGGSRPVFQRTATIGGLTITSPSNWFLVDYWGDWNPDATSLVNHAIPLLELTNFDPGLSTPVCAAEPGESTRLPAGGVAIFVRVGNDGSKVADLCGGSIHTSSTGTVGHTPYETVMAVGPDATAHDRSTAEQIWRSIAWTGPLTTYGRGRSPRYLLDGWRHGSTNVLVEAFRGAKNVELSYIEVGTSGDSGSDYSFTRPNPIEGDTLGAVTQNAVRVEYRRAGIATAFPARLIDLPPSLHAGFDAFVVESPPAGGPAETVAIGPKGKVLGSTLPPLTDTRRVGTLRAFGTTWTLRLSRSPDGYAAPCVQPSATGSGSGPCTFGWGGGLLVQSFHQPKPAVFVSEYVGGTVGAVDVVADDDRVFHAVMVPVRGGGVVAVVALEGGGRGRLVYHMTDGRTDQGNIEWTDVGQLIGKGSFPPPGHA